VKLLYVVPSPGRIGGVATSTRRIVNALLSAGVDVCLHCPEDEDWPGKPSNDLERQYDEMLGHSAARMCRSVETKIAELEPDLIVGYYASTMGFIAVAAGQLANVPVVLSVRGNDVNRDFFSALYARRLDHAVRHCAALAVNSTELAHKLRCWFDRAATYIPNATDHGLYYRDAAAGAKMREAWRVSFGLDTRPLVGVFGEFKLARGLELLEAVKGTLSASQVLLVGEIRAEARARVPSWVHCVPYIRDPEALRAAYNACDVVLQPSTSEGMPNVVLEAMACERLVIGAPVGGIRDAINDGQTGYLCSSIDSWCSRLSVVLERTRRGDTSEYEAMGRRARSSTPQPEHEAQRFLALFNRVLDKQPRALPGALRSGRGPNAVGPEGSA
jgi:glycosyltransferase involved in cell wall biosynthesis